MIRHTGKELEAILNKSVQIKWNQAKLFGFEIDKQNDTKRFSNTDADPYYLI